MRRILGMAMLMAAALTVAAAAQAQDRYPSREINLIVPFAAGGGTDLTGRAVAEALKGVLGQPVTVQNLPGAGSATGLTRLSEQKGDGYTIGMMGDRKSTRLNSSHVSESRMPSSA